MKLPFDSSLPLVTLTTDGAAQPNPGKGGWACVLRCGNAYREISGRSEIEPTTNNIMELRAIVEGLAILTRPCRVEVRTDSKIAMAWSRPNYFEKKNRRGRFPVAAELANRLAPLLQMHTVSFSWVMGHNGDPDNERCDYLATTAARHLSCNG